MNAFKMNKTGCEMDSRECMLKQFYTVAKGKLKIHLFIPLAKQRRK